MKVSIAIALMGIMGIGVGAIAENISSMAPLIPLTGDELMFIMDVPVVPAQDTPIVLAQVSTSGTAATPQPDFILKDCQQTPSTGPSWSAGRGVDPAGMLSIYMQNKYNRPVEFSAVKNVTLLEDTTVGKITSVIDNTGRSWYRYDPPPDTRVTSKPHLWPSTKASATRSW